MDRTAIANIALTELGADLIADLGQNVNNAKVCLARYDDVRDAVLRDHPWNCAQFRFALPAMGERPAFGFAYQYALPTDPYCLRVLRLACDVPWKVEGRKILTDQAAPLRGLYVGRIGEDQMDALLAHAVGLRLGAAIAYRLTTSQSQVERMWQLYRDTLRSARSVDGQEGSPEAFADSALLDSRI